MGGKIPQAQQGGGAVGLAGDAQRAVGLALADPGGAVAARFGQQFAGLAQERGGILFAHDELVDVADGAQDVGQVPLAGFRFAPGGDVDERGHDAALHGQAGDFHHVPGAVLGRDGELHGFHDGMIPAGLCHGGVPGGQHFPPVRLVGIGPAPPLGDRGHVRGGVAEQLAEAVVDEGNGSVRFDQAGGYGRTQDQLAEALVVFAPEIVFPLARGDLHDRAAEPQGAAGVVENILAYRRHPVDAGIGPDHAEFADERCADIPAPFHFGLKAGQIVGMHAGSESFKGAGELAGLEAP